MALQRGLQTPRQIPAATHDALLADGVVCHSFDEFVAFIAQLELTLRQTQSPETVTDDDVLPWFRSISTSSLPIGRVTIIPNLGSAPLAVTDVKISGAASEQFKITNNSESDVEDDA